MRAVPGPLEGWSPDILEILEKIAGTHTTPPAPWKQPLGIEPETFLPRGNCVNHSTHGKLKNKTSGGRSGGQEEENNKTAALCASTQHHSEVSQQKWSSTFFWFIAWI